MKRILLVEDDKTLGQTLTHRLSQQYRTEWAANRKTALERLAVDSYDLVILDVGLPDGSGFDVARSLTGPSKPPFLFLTAQGDAETRLEGYEMGAQEFIPKPFHLKELLLRVQHVLHSHAPAEEIDLGTCRVDLQRQSVFYPDGRIEYPPVRDLQILKLLIERSPRALSRDEIMDTVWGEERDTNPRTVDNAVARLRQLIGDEKEQFIRSVRGVGYRWAYGEVVE